MAREKHGKKHVFKGAAVDVFSWREARGNLGNLGNLDLDAVNIWNLAAWWFVDHPSGPSCSTLCQGHVREAGKRHGQQWTGLSTLTNHGCWMLLEDI